MTIRSPTVSEQKKRVGSEEGRVDIKREKRSEVKLRLAKEGVKLGSDKVAQLLQKGEGKPSSARFIKTWKKRTQTRGKEGAKKRLS